ncbi:MAG: FkbM family methyltransferase [Candidatus Shapirobacteria bacterium]|nr:FkbM family methyltransferase [Candidatus Shapirobacteria bacterium]
MLISSNDSLERRFTKTLLRISPWNNVFVKKTLAFLKNRPRLFSGLISTVQLSSEKHEMVVFKQLIRSGMTVIDIGANIGIYTTEAARLVGKQGRVIAFEPEKYNFQLLTERVRKSGYKNITLENIALSNKKGEQTFYIDSVNLGNHSFSQKNIYDGAEAIRVHTTTIDKYLQEHGISKVDVIKIDVQGAEPLVLAGARKLLKDQSPAILLEYWPVGIKNLGQDPDKFLRSLSEYGFRFMVVDKHTKDTNPISLSALIAESRNWQDSTDYVNLLLKK